MFLITVCLLFITWYLISYLKWRKEILIPLQKIPGPKRYPIFGTIYQFFGVSRDDLFAFYTNHVKEMPAVFCSWNGSLPEVNIKKPEHLELIMNNSVHITKGSLYQYLLPWLGEGLLISRGSKWHKHRKLITPTFHFKILENFMSIFEEKSKLLVEQLGEKADGQYFNIYPYITHCTLDVICETAMGVAVNAMQNNESEYVKSIYRICNVIVWRSINPYCYRDSIFYLFPQGREFYRMRKFLHNFSYKVISDRRKIFQANRMHEADQCKRVRLSFLDLLLEASDNGSMLSNDDIRAEVDTFMFEGHDTTTASISWTLFMLGNNPDIQAKVFSELQEIMGEKAVPTTIDELNQMKYLECVIKEALRLYPSVALIIRTITEEIYIDKYRIPKGVEAVLHIYQVHRDPEHFPEPEKFDPDRFLPENTAGRHPYAYIPFSAGPRNCIGQKFAMYEEKTILASIVKQFQIKSADTPETIKPVGDIILRPGGGLKVKLTKRK